MLVRLSLLSHCHFRIWITIFLGCRVGAMLVRLSLLSYCHFLIWITIFFWCRVGAMLVELSLLSYCHFLIWVRSDTPKASCSRSKRVSELSTLSQPSRLSRPSQPSQPSHSQSLHHCCALGPLFLEALRALRLGVTLALADSLARGRLKDRLGRHLRKSVRQWREPLPRAWPALDRGASRVSPWRDAYTCGSTHAGSP